AEYPGFAGPLLNLGLMRGRAGDEVGAQALFERAALVCSHCGSVWNELGVLHGRHGRFTEAEEAYHRAIEVEPGFAAAYYNLAIIYELYIPRPDLALQNYEQYLQLGGTAGEGQDVEKWVAELRRRVGATPTAARTGVSP
ncbi:MAG: tetratricopeptide repeat protein, partial [Gammaproteobacteria bacterium]|nr:tetratricopeptide repeat protein [Gammaproteobacteria bacterium]